jgi:hypothetical protein
MCLVLLTVASYFHRYPTGDDAWFAEQSYWFEKEGIIRSEFFRGMGGLGWEKQLLVSHKLFLLFGAGMIHLFGYQLPVVQFVGLIFFCILIGELIIYVRRREHKFNSWYLVSLLILVFSNRLLIKMSFENRPELMLAALGFGSFLLIDSKERPVTKVIFAGLFAGLAMLCHLNGVIYLLAGAGVLIYLRQYKRAFLFSIVGGLTCMAYFVDIAQAENGFSTWYYQFRNDTATQNNFGLYPKLIVLLTYPRLFFYSPEQIALSLLLVFMLWSQREFIKKLPVSLKAYSLLLLVTFWIITKHASGTYLPLFMPFMFALIYELYRARPFINIGLRIAIVLYFIIGLYGTGQIFYKNFSLEYLPTAYQRLRRNIPHNTIGLVPLTFFFNEYEQYSHLLSHENFTYYSKHPANSSEEMARWAHKNKVGFILMDYRYRPEYFYPKPGTTVLPFYKLKYFDGRFAVYMKQ